MQPIVTTKTIFPISDAVSTTDTPLSPTKQPVCTTDTAEPEVDEIILRIIKFVIL